MLRIAMLGPLEVTRDGQLVTVPGGKTSELLVRLAVEPGVAIRADRLVDDLWGPGAFNTRRDTLQSKITRLRRALGHQPLIVTGEGGYALFIEPSDVDALAVPGLGSTATRLLAAGDDRGAADVCASTLKLYRGEVLPSARDGDWVTPHRARLEEARMKLMEVQFTARSRLGEVGDAIGELEAAVATYPYQERLWELLIAGLYGAGRQADALAAYRRIKDRLADELGLDPGPQLQLLQDRILKHDNSLSSRPHRRRPDAVVGNLPSMAVDLVGREADIDAVSALLASKRLVDIVGPGGIGKTAVAIATGRQLGVANGIATGGTWLARLETATTADDVTDTVIASLGVSGREEALLERFRGIRALLILDNCEQVIDAAANLAVRLLDAAPGLRIMCTSQVPLDVDGEAVYELAPLTLPDAVELFTHRATAQRLTPGSDEGDPAVLALCRSLDGLPLAIELAAARTKTLSVEEITRRLQDRFTVLNDPSSRRPERRRSLRSTIRWSYELLFPDDQRGLWALATFAGGAPLPAVEFVLEALEVPAAAAMDVVGRLASRSLVMVDDDGPSASWTARPEPGLPRSVRYRLLDSIRAFAIEAMTDAGLHDRAFAAHATWFAEAATLSTQGVRSSSQAQYLSFARAERANIDAALAWSVKHDPLLALGLVSGFGWAWVVLGDSRGAQRIAAALDAVGDNGQAGDRATALLLAAWIEASMGDLDVARNHIAAASELAGSIDDIDLQARCLYYLAYVVSHRGDFREALELTDRSRALYEGLDRPWDQAANWLFAARAAISAGDEERSVEAAERVQHWLRAVDDPWLTVRGDAVHGELARMQRRFADAVDHLGRAAQASGRMGFLQTQAYQLSSLGRAQCQAGDYLAGSATLEDAVEKAEAIGDMRLAALARVHLGRVLRALGHVAQARQAIETATAWHRGAGGGEQAALGECLLAAMDAAEHVPGAEERLVAILEEVRQNDEATHVEVFALDALARIAAVAGDITTARDLCGTADRRMEAASNFIADLDRSDAHLVRHLVGEDQ